MYQNIILNKAANSDVSLHHLACPDRELDKIVMGRYKQKARKDVHHTYNSKLLLVLIANRCSLLGCSVRNDSCDCVLNSSLSSGNNVPLTDLSTIGFTHFELMIQIVFVICLICGFSISHCRVPHQLALCIYRLFILIRQMVWI